MDELKLLDFVGFYQRWFEVLKDSKTHREAYDKVEAEYQAFFKRRRYRNFETFQVVRCRYFKKNKRI
jgi:hypothetical protein